MKRVSLCGLDGCTGFRACRACRNAYMRKWRSTPKGKRSERRYRLKSITRSYANVYQSRGLLTPQPCQFCLSETHIEKHHPNYRKPLLVIWLCRKCHRALHRISGQKCG